jgi:hypothetical protein
VEENEIWLGQSDWETMGVTLQQLDMKDKFEM